jgi:hypothetical protein
MDNQPFTLHPTTNYFSKAGVEVVVFEDIYPEGRQAGISIIMHDQRVATCGDIRFEPTPGQWQPVPQQKKRDVDVKTNTVTIVNAYPHQERHLKGMNPMIYPDFAFEYTITVKGEGDSIVVTVDLDQPVPARFLGKLCFNLELFPGDLFGKPWLMDGKAGIFPPQPNGPLLQAPANSRYPLECEPTGIIADRQQLADPTEYNPIIADDIIATPYAVGRRFTVRPDDPLSRLTIASEVTDLQLYDGRLNHNNGWFTVSSTIPAETTKQAVRWVITPNAVADWLRSPVIQLSQVGYHPQQAKIAVIELDRRDEKREKVQIQQITETGQKVILAKAAEEWGHFLRYDYLRFDFTEIQNEGLYQVTYGTAESSVFRIATDIYERGVWQPVLEYFLPVQMCHMRVSEKYRVWHGLCHSDDARMAPLNRNHFDGYLQGASTLTPYQPGDSIVGLDKGGWHDAGDFDLRVESQAGEVYILALAYEAFQVDYDTTYIDQLSQTVEIHQPDGKNDLLQQIEHGVLSIVGGYRALGRLYRGIIESSLRQYVHLGDSAVMSDGIKGNDDDRLVFTEDNPPKELTCAAQLAAAAHVLRGFNEELSAEALKAARELYAVTDGSDEAWFARVPAATLQAPPGPPGMAKTDRTKVAKIHAASELFLATKRQEYRDFLISERNFICENPMMTGWMVARVARQLNDEAFQQALEAAMSQYSRDLKERCLETPYGIPYRPHIWGAGWIAQRLAFQHYFLHQAYPDIFDPALIFNTLNFVLGCHPGENNSSFASGVGAKSATVAYGQNRADWSYIPGGVISGTALIRPDFPELKVFPYLWQQSEYVLGGGSSCFMFLVLAVKEFFKFI